MNDISEVFYPRGPQDPLEDRLAQVEGALHELSKDVQAIQKQLEALKERG